MPSQGPDGRRRSVTPHRRFSNDSRVDVVPYMSSEEDLHNWPTRNRLTKLMQPLKSVAKAAGGVAHDLVNACKRVVLVGVIVN